MRFGHGRRNAVEEDKGDGGHRVVDGIFFSESKKVFGLKEKRIDAIVSASSPYQVQSLSVSRDHLHPRVALIADDIDGDRHKVLFLLMNFLRPLFLFGIGLASLELAFLIGLTAFRRNVFEWMCHVGISF